MGLRFPSGGSEDRVDITSDVLDFNNDFTVMWWLEVSGTWTWGGWKLFGITDTTDSYTDYLAIQATDDIVLVHFGPVEGFQVGTPVSLPSPGTPVHIVLQRDGANLRLFLDGVLEDTLLATVGSRTAAEEMEIHTNSTHAVDLDFGAMKAWTRALTASQIRSEMLTNVPWDANNNYAHWPFFDAELRDYSGQGHDWVVDLGGVSAVSDPKAVVWGRGGVHGRCFGDDIGKLADVGSKQFLSDAARC